MAATLELPGSAADYDHRQGIVIVLVSVAHAAAVQHNGVIEEIAVAIRRCLQLVDEVRQHLDMITVDQRESVHLGAGV